MHSAKPACVEAIQWVISTWSYYYNEILSRSAVLFR